MYDMYVCMYNMYVCIMYVRKYVCKPSLSTLSDKHCWISLNGPLVKVILLHIVTTKTSEKFGKTIDNLEKVRQENTKKYR